MTLALGLTGASAPAQLPTVEVPLPGAEPLRFRRVPEGSFIRGSPATEAHRDPDEGPAHAVTLTRSFYLGVYEVTQGQWRAVMGTEPGAFRHGPEADRRPVSSVSWEDAQAFIARLNARGREQFRLPTEAEWEYAARAGTTTAYSWGDDPGGARIHDQAWANSRSMGLSHPVGTKPPNPWGIHDLHGNVWEWCSDWYAPYPQEAVSDPTGPGSGTEKVFRGGSWFDFHPAHRSANRHRHRPQERYTAVGFRLVLEPAAVRADRVIALPGGVEMAFLTVRAGSYLRGSAAEEAGRAADEGPQHRVTLSRDFLLGQTEVTQAQWQAVMRGNPAVFRDGVDAPQRPVEWVSWNDAQAFIAALNALGLGRFRLPTEAEWEYAARAGTSTRFPWGDDPGHRELPAHGWGNPRSEGRSHRVATRRPNPWGFHDLAGNVWEWCADWKGAYPENDVTDPAGPPTGTVRIIRGGSWFNEPEALRSANRHGHPPDSRQTNLGLRLVLEPAP